MKIISLNTWGGRIYAPFISFLEKHRVDTDIFCFQEVYNNPLERLGDDLESRLDLFNEIAAALPNHVGYFSPQVVGVGMATFVRQNFAVASASSSVVLAAEEMEERFIPRVLQHISIMVPSISIYNFHGVPKSDKRDTAERKLQSDRVLEVLLRDNNPKILVGDFNLRPETNCLRAFEKGMKNLIIQNGFTTTRSSHYQFRTVQPYADYAFVSSEILVEDFQVLSDEVSDHLPLAMEFNVR